MSFQNLMDSENFQNFKYFIKVHEETVFETLKSIGNFQVSHLDSNLAWKFDQSLKLKFKDTKSVKFHIKIAKRTIKKYLFKVPVVSTNISKTC